MMEAKNILISGCSGGGKSTLLDLLRQHGHPVVEEPGRRIVAEEMKGNGDALPWVDLRAFADRAIRMAQADLCAAADMEGIVFFDRGLVDAAVAFEFAGGTPYHSLLAGERHYARRVFLAPPWPEIFATDMQRRNTFEDAIAEYSRLERAFSELGYETCELPKVAVADRINFVLKELRTG